MGCYNVVIGKLHYQETLGYIFACEAKNVTPGIFIVILYDI